MLNFMDSDAVALLYHTHIAAQLSLLDNPLALGIDNAPAISRDIIIQHRQVNPRHKIVKLRHIFGCCFSPQL